MIIVQTNCWNQKRRDVLIAQWCGVLVLGLVASALSVRADGDIIQFGDVAQTKQKAERGDVHAQITLGQCLVANARAAEALGWYRRAAEKGSVEAKARLGELLLLGANASTPDQRVAPNPLEGVRWTYEAATNAHPGAARNMARALQCGLGVRTNGTEAMAWFLYCAATNSTAVRVEMNRLALTLSTEEIREAQVLAYQLKSRRWPPLTIIKAPAEAPAEQAPLPLKVNGISVGANGSLVIINRKTLAEGETAAIPISSGKINIRCLKISEGAVLIEVEGESEPRLLCVN